MDSTRTSSPVATISASASDEIVATGVRGGIATIAVPTVARIWITDHDISGPSPAANVFAEVAQVADLRPDVLVSESPSAAGSQANQSVSSKPATAVAKTPRSGNTWSWTFRLAVLAMIILAVLALVYLNFAA